MHQTNSYILKGKCPSKSLKKVLPFSKKKQSTNQNICIFALLTLTEVAHVQKRCVVDSLMQEKNL